MTWIVYDSPIQGKHEVGEHGCFTAGRPVEMTPERTECLLKCHPHFRLATAGEIPTPAEKPVLKPVGKAARALTKARAKAAKRRKAEKKEE